MCCTEKYGSKNKNATCSSLLLLFILPFDLFFLAFFLLHTSFCDGIVPSGSLFLGHNVPLCCFSVSVFVVLHVVLIIIMVSFPFHCFFWFALGHSVPLLFSGVFLRFPSFCSSSDLQHGFMFRLFSSFPHRAVAKCTCFLVSDWNFRYGQPELLSGRQFSIAHSS